MMNYEDVKTQAKACKTSRELSLLLDKVDSLFMQDVPGVIMTDEDWVNLTSLVYELDPTLPDS